MEGNIAKHLLSVTAYMSQWVTAVSIIDIPCMILCPFKWLFWVFGWSFLGLFLVLHVLRWLLLMLVNDCFLTWLDGLDTNRVGNFLLSVWVRSHGLG